MSRRLCFTQDAWDDCRYWQKIDKKMLKRINRLLAEIVRAPFDGIGKPEILRGDLSGAWSRRVDNEHRVVYMVFDNEVSIINCRQHYPKN